MPGPPDFQTFPRLCVSFRSSGTFWWRLKVLYLCSKMSIKLRWQLLDSYVWAGWWGLYLLTWFGFFIIFVDFAGFFLRVRINIYVCFWWRTQKFLIWPCIYPKISGNPWITLKSHFFIISRYLREFQKFGSHTDISHFYIHLYPIIDKLVATYSINYLCMLLFWTICTFFAIHICMYLYSQGHL